MINTRLRGLKTILWAIMGILAVLTLVRFANGLGATTALNDTSPWGFWIAFDVMAGVALAAGGFTLAAVVYIFGLERFRPFARPAILTAFLGYSAVAVGLLYDLGLPWHIWHPMIFPQPHSVLFEVAMCVMLYLTVLFLEFSPVLLEHPLFNKPILQKIHRGLKRAVIPLVIAGIVLSTLHQSSLGSLFLITPYRLHPLWYSPIIWVLFFTSAVGLGLMMVALESFFSGWVFKHKPRMDLLGALGRAASVVLFVYAGLRLLDLAVRGQMGAIFDGSWQATVFIAELLVSALIPATLLSLRRVRTSPRGMCLSSILVVAGMIGYRFNVCIVAFKRPEGMGYFPSWMEIFVSAGIVAGALLVFLFLVENFKVFPESEEKDGTRSLLPGGSLYAPWRASLLTPYSLAAPRRYTLALVVGAALCLAALPSDALTGPTPEPVPVTRPRQIEDSFLIDGNRDGRIVRFPHAKHVAKLGEKDSCALCHHANLPFQQHSACAECHSDMYSPHDIFDHASHVAKLGEGTGCVRCHADGSLAKTRANTTSCAECHADMLVAGSRVAPPAGGMKGYAAGYMSAMHGLCIKCHEERVAKEPGEYERSFAQCGNCHRGERLDLERMGPYAPPQAAAKR